MPLESSSPPPIGWRWSITASELKPGQLRVRTASPASPPAPSSPPTAAPTRTYRTWDPSARLFRDGASRHRATRWPAGATPRSARWSRSSPGRRRRPGLPAVGDLVWGIWGHRSEGVVPAERHASAARCRRAGPARRRLRPGRRHRATTPCSPPTSTSARTSPSSARASSACSPPGSPQLNGARVIAVDALDRPARDGPPLRRRRHVSTPATDARRRAQLRGLTDGRGADVAIEISGVLPGPARGDPRRSPSAAGWWPPASTRATASGCGSARSSTTTASSSICSQIGGVPPAARRPLDRRAAPADLPAAGRRRQGRRRRRWSATSSRSPTRPTPTSCWTSVPPRRSRSSWTSERPAA